MSNTPMPESTTRRQFVGAAAAATAGLTAGLATGAVLGAQTVLHNQPAQKSAASARRRFDGKVVAITGATSGIGRAAAIAFAAEGAKVGFCGRREALGREVQDQITLAGGTAAYIRADVRVEEQVQAFIDRVVQTFGRLDVAFNNAGISVERPLHELTSAEFDDMVNTDLRGVFLAMKYEIPYMIAGGGGNIVVTSSSNAIATTAKRPAYAAAKRGLVALVQSAALAYAPHHIRVNTLVPGTTDTALVRRIAGMMDVPDAVWELAAAQWAKTNIPGEGRMATAEEIASFALVLASDDHPYMTGAALVIDGGKTAHGG
jgi:NAD(P)-dependent dehydrogenase (short-subunit alcohol dehydrogenase family)